MYLNDFVKLLSFMFNQTDKMRRVLLTPVRARKHYNPAVQNTYTYILDISWNDFKIIIKQVQYLGVYKFTWTR